jgi:hypothetical protein
VDECTQYVHLPSGIVEHSRAKNTPDPTVAGENHGDRVIADALAWAGMADQIRPEAKADDTLSPPLGTFGWRRILSRRKKKAEFDW